MCLATEGCIIVAETVYYDLAGADIAAGFPSLGPRLGRGLLQNGDADDSTTNERPLAVKKDRLDPFNDFHKYRGGFDVESKHYWGVLLYFILIENSSGSVQE